MPEQPVENYAEFLESMNRWTENSNWTPRYDGRDESISSIPNGVDLYYKHSSGGELHLQVDNEGENIAEGSVFLSPDPRETIAFYDVDHDYLSKPEIAMNSELEEVDEIIKEIDIPHSYDQGKLQEMFSTVDEIFEGPDYSLSDITR